MLGSDAVHIIEDAWSRDAQFIDPEVYGTPDYIAPEVIMGQPYGKREPSLVSILLGEVFTFPVVDRVSC